MSCDSLLCRLEQEVGRRLDAEESANQSIAKIAFLRQQQLQVCDVTLMTQSFSINYCFVLYKLGFQHEKEFKARLQASTDIISMLDGKLGELSKMGYDQLPALLQKIRQMTAGKVHVHPVAVDADYGRSTPILLSAIKKKKYRFNRNATERPLLDRLGLHAAQLTLTHPETGEEKTFEAPRPKDFKALLNQLGKWDT